MYRPRLVEWPQVRRFFRLHPCRRSTLPVFSACPEVFLNKAENRPTGGGLLRVSGGFSRRLSLGVAQSQSSPRVRRFFQTCFSKPNREAVFSACPEVFLGRGAAAGTQTSLLRVSGGFSPCRRLSRVFAQSSPRVRRFFLVKDIFDAPKAVFSACPEVFPSKLGPASSCIGLLRVSGGFSN